jgi:hypothetical protein
MHATAMRPETDTDRIFLADAWDILDMYPIKLAPGPTRKGREHESRPENMLVFTFCTHIGAAQMKDYHTC